MRVDELMTSDVPVAGPQDRVMDVARQMTEAGVKAMPVCEGDKVAGIITDWDVTRAVADGDRVDAKRVGDYMTADVLRVDVDTPVSEAGHLMAEHRIHHLLVTDGDRFAGVLHLDVEWADLGGLGVPHATFAAPI